METKAPDGFQNWSSFLWTDIHVSCTNYTKRTLGCTRPHTRCSLSSIYPRPFLLFPILPFLLFSHSLKPFLPREEKERKERAGNGLAICHRGLPAVPPSRHRGKRRTGNKGLEGPQKGWGAQTGSSEKHAPIETSKRDRHLWKWDLKKIKTDSCERGRPHFFFHAIQKGKRNGAARNGLVSLLLLSLFSLSPFPNGFGWLKGDSVSVGEKRNG